MLKSFHITIKAQQLSSCARVQAKVTSKEPFLSSGSEKIWKD